MKKISLTLLAVILFIAATLKASAQTEQTRQVSGFNGIAASASFSIHVKIDGTESLKISADKDIINDIETEVKDGTLKIGMKNSFSWFRHVGKVDIYVTAKSLSALSNSGSGNIKIDAGELTGNDVTVKISGSGSITATVKSTGLNAHVSGSGTVNLTGSSNDADVTVSGSGQIRGQNFKALSVKAGISGSGNVYINADKSITAHISGSGSLVYSGNATNIDSSVSGSGRIRKEKIAV